MTEMIFFNIGWMEHYQGLSTGDSIEGGGYFVPVYGYGHEIYNFLPWNGTMYGFVEVKGELLIERIGARTFAPSVPRILVVWVARDPNVGGTYIVGWYKDATVYRRYQAPTWAKNRLIEEEIAPGIKADSKNVGKYFSYIACAPVENCTLLPPNQRNFQIPRGSYGQMGRRNIWYADDTSMAAFRRSVIEYVNGIDTKIQHSFRKYGRGGESPAHKQLKDWCANHPGELGLSNVRTVPGTKERSFICGDSADVMFEMTGNRYAVLEVETDTPKPGAHQALKYKTLLCAEKEIPVTSDDVTAILVAWKIPPDVRSFCDFYGITCVEKRV